MLKVCAVCPEYATPGQSRCPTHATARRRAKRLRRQSRPGDGAANRIRRQLNKVEAGMKIQCANCRHFHSPSNVQVDHIIPLADGGTDYDSNVQILCADCHTSKTRAENKQRK